MLPYRDSPLECEPYISKSRLIYITNIYKVTKESIILFKLSNGFIQAHHYDTNTNLLLTDDDLLMLELKDGQEVSRHLEKKADYAKCPAAMVKMYLQVKKIMVKISNRG